MHSFAGIGLGKGTKTDCEKFIRKSRKAVVRWQKTKVLVIDEISMCDGDFWDKLEHCARALRNNAKPFGGLQLVITGDFFQLPPVNCVKMAFEAQTWKVTFFFFWFFFLFK